MFLESIEVILTKKALQLPELPPPFSSPFLGRQCCMPPLAQKAFVGYRNEVDTV